MCVSIVRGRQLKSVLPVRVVFCGRPRSIPPRHPVATHRNCHLLKHRAPLTWPVVHSPKLRRLLSFAEVSVAELPYSRHHKAVFIEPGVNFRAYHPNQGIPLTDCMDSLRSRYQAEQVHLVLCTSLALRTSQLLLGSFRLSTTSSSICEEQP